LIFIPKVCLLIDTITLSRSAFSFCSVNKAHYQSGITEIIAFHDKKFICTTLKILHISQQNRKVKDD